MSELQIFNSEPATSIIANMRFPKDAAKANALASQILSSGPLRIYCDQGMSLSQEEWLNITSSVASVDIREEAARKEFMGKVAGAVVKVLLALIHHNPSTASWKAAIRIVDKIALEKRGRQLGAGTFYKFLKEMRPCLHLWGAAAIRNDVFGAMWVADASVNYDGYTDVQFFLAESEIVLRELLIWNERYKVDSHHLCEDHFRVPAGWQPPQRKPDWPITGVVHIPMLASDMISRRGRPGRPSNKMAVSSH